VRQEQAVTITGYERAELLPVPADSRPLAPSEVSGRTLATMISPGTELAACYQGSQFPAVPGYAAVFAVEQVGAEVTGIKMGDRCFCMGPHRSFQRTGEREAIPVPEGLASEQAVLARAVAISMTTLATTTARPPDRVLVTGLGLVGHLAAQVFRHAGYEVAGYDPLPARRAQAETHGLRTVPELAAEHTGEVALVVECSGHEQAALAGCRLVRKRGEVVLVGVPWRQQTELSAHELLHAVFHQYAVLRSGWEWEVPRQESEFRVGSIYAHFRAALRWLAQGAITVDGLYCTCSPGQAQEAYRGLLGRQGEHLTVVFDWSGMGE